jgi:hypothetical protein
MLVARCIQCERVGNPRHDMLAALQLWPADSSYESADRVVLSLVVVTACKVSEASSIPIKPKLRKKNSNSSLLEVRHALTMLVQVSLADW